jgi:hypothetical protein
VACDSSSEAEGSDSDDPDPLKERALARREKEEGEARSRIPKKSKALWSESELKNLKKNFKAMETIDDSILARLTLKEIIALGGKRDKNQKYLTEKLADNYERVRSFRVEA